MNMQHTYVFAIPISPYSKWCQLIIYTVCNETISIFTNINDFIKFDFLFFLCLSYEWIFKPTCNKCTNWLNMVNGYIWN